MADIDQIIAGGAGASSRADFSGIAKIADAFYKSRDEAAKNDQRTVFQNGVPIGQDGQPDFAAMGKALFQQGGFDQGVAASNLGIQRDQLKLGQQVSDKMGRMESGGQTPQAQPVLPPSVNRSGSAVVAPPVAAGQQPQGQPAQPQSNQSGHVGTLGQALTAQGVPNDQIGAASASIARQLGLQDPNAQLNFDDPQIRNVVVPAIQQLKRMGIGQVQPQGQPQAPQAVQPQQAPPQQPAPQQVVQQAPAPPQQQANPQQNQGTFGAPSAIATRGAIPTGTDPEIQKQIATYTAIASNPAFPKSVEEAALSRLKALQDQGQPTGPMKEYDLYRRQGGTASFQDFAAENEAGKAGATERAKADVKEQQDFISQGRMGQQRLQTLNTISNIISSDKNLDLGFGSETTLKVKMALEKAGFDFGDLSGGQLIQKLNGILASESSKSFSTRPTQFEFKTFLANNPGLALDEKGNIRMLGILSQNAKRDADLGKLARQNQDNWSKWDDVVEKYDSDHPIKDPTTGRVLSNHSIIAPGPAPGKTGPVKFNSPADVHAAVAAGTLKKGQTFTDPNGVQRIVP